MLHPNPPTSSWTPSLSPWNPLYCSANPKIAHFKAFWELAWANMHQRWFKMASDHLSEHPKCSTNNFGKNHFLPLWDPQVTPVTVHNFMDCTEAPDGRSTVDLAISVRPISAFWLWLDPCLSPRL